MMSVTSATEVTYLKGVGPQRAAIFASRGIYTASDLLLYLPFRYEDRIHFNQISHIVPGGVYTIHGSARPSLRRGGFTRPRICCFICHFAMKTAFTSTRFHTLCPAASTPFTAA